MQCTSPVFNEAIQMMLPCKRCLMCKIAYSREWSMRMLHEADSHDKNVFVTLTYSDENLPDDMSVKKDVAQRFLKRLRKILEPEKIRYYLCGEYGEKTSRPHYHLIIFGMSMADNKTEVIGRGSKKIIACLDGPLNAAWKEGFIALGNVTEDSTRYVADYMVKQLRYNDDVLGRTKPFVLMSKGLGREYVDKNSKQLENNMTIRQSGYNVNLPEYYRKRLNIDIEKYYERLEKRFYEIDEEFERKYGMDEEVKFDKKIAAIRVKNKNMERLRELKRSKI